MTDKAEEPAMAVSRRQALIRSTGGVTLWACATLAGCATTSKVQGSTPKAQVAYQDHPSGLERCGLCKHFIPTSGCEVVVAPVAANGWCKAYAL